MRRGLSAGRVQSVAVRLIVERENEIKAFKPNEYWEIFAEVNQLISEPVIQKNSFKIQLIKQEVTDKTNADEILKDLEIAKYKVSEVKKREVRKTHFLHLQLPQ